MQNRIGEKELEAALSAVEFPGDDPTDLEEQCVSAGIPDRVMEKIRTRPGPYWKTERAWRFSSHRRFLLAVHQRVRWASLWSGAALLNILLILLFEGRPMLIDSAVGPGDFYSGLMFLFLSISASISITGCVLSMKAWWLSEKAIP